ETESQPVVAVVRRVFVDVEGTADRGPCRGGVGAQDDLLLDAQQPVRTEDVPCPGGVLRRRPVWNGAIRGITGELQHPRSEGGQEPVASGAMVVMTLQCSVSSLLLWCDPARGSSSDRRRQE